MSDERRFEQDQRRIDRPVPGFYKRRSHSKGPCLPAIVYSALARDPYTLATMDRAPTLVCVVDGEERDLEREWPGLHPISEAEYKAMAELRLDPDRVPDFGQGLGYNTRDAELAAAAAIALANAGPGDRIARLSAQEFRKIALLIKQIIEVEKTHEEGYKAEAKPLREQLERVRAEWKCEAADYQHALRQALTAYAESLGIPPCPECAPHWRDMPPEFVIEQDKVPRKFCSPDDTKIKAALKRGEKVRGVSVRTRREIVVV